MPGGLARFTFAAALACCTVSAGAQVIRGTIKSQDTDTPVPGARVTVTDTTNTVLAEVVSGPDGKFYLSFKSSSRFVVGVRKVGWHPSFTEPMQATAADTMLVDFMVPAEPTEIASAEISGTAAPTSFNGSAMAEARRKGWKVYAPEAVERFRNTAGNFVEMMREIGATGLNFGKGDCVRSLRYNRCLMYVVDGQPAGTAVLIPPGDVYFFAVLSASESASQWGDKAPWGAIVVYTRMNGDKRNP